MRKYLIAICALMLGNNLMAQYKCATDYYDSIEVAANPLILEKRAELDAFTTEYINKEFKNAETITIPMVFHVLHEYGDERINMSVVERAIEQLNKDFNAENTELSNIISAFKNIIGNANFRFKLAKIDPDGNCTTGVVYYNTPLTHKASNSLKSSIKNWDPASYLNVWTVKSIESGAAAWSHYPSSADLNPGIDGVVSLYTYIDGHTLGHEVGHYLNLPHPWGSTNEPGLDSNCDIDDGVEDTPLTIGADQHCKLDQVSCGSLDNVQNFMDYSTCDAMFTAGQAERMRAALNSAIGDRKYLWTPENLLATGTNEGYIVPTCTPLADFSDKIPDVVPGDTLQFVDYSYASTPTRWNWVFEGGIPATATEQHPKVAYNTPGLYSVSLQVGNDIGENELLRENIVFVTDTLKGIVAPVNVDMEEEGFPHYPGDIFKAWSFEDAGSAYWNLYSTDNRSMRIKNRNNAEGTINSMITSNINLSEIENPDYLFFDYAYAQLNMASADELKIFVSADCGKKWIIKSIKSGKSLVTSQKEYVVDDFIPADSEWKQERIDITRYKNNNFLKIKFQIESKGGNYLYIDNLKVGEPLVINLPKSKEMSFNIFPNPAKGELMLDFVLPGDTKVVVEVANILGKEIMKKEIRGRAGINKHTLDLSSANFSNGVYLISVRSAHVSLSKPFVIQK